MNAPLHHRMLTFAFLLITGSVPILQLLVEAGRAERPQICDLFTEWPSQSSLRTFEQALERASVTIRFLRPRMQALAFFGLHEAGEKALVGRGGWLFYSPGMAATTQRSRPGSSTEEDALTAVKKFRDQLSARGIRLLLLPVPNKESLYPDRLLYPTEATQVRPSPEMQRFLAGCKKDGVEVVDLFMRFQSMRRRSTTDLYLVQDSHWTPEGLSCAADAVAGRILSLGWMTPGGERYTEKEVLVRRHGDLVQMLQSPQIEKRLPQETISAKQVVRLSDHSLYADDAKSEVLVLGDSFLRQYERDEPRHAGFVAHLALALGRPVASIVNDGGASTLVRQELHRRPTLLAGKKVVVWEFVERDLRLGMEGWAEVPLPDACDAQ